MSTLQRADPLQPGLDPQIAPLAARQHGVFSRSQAMDVGATRSAVRHRTAIGRWEEAARDVFRLTGARTSWKQALMIACLAWGPGATISHVAAAVMWALAGFEVPHVELTVPRTRRRNGPGVVHRNALSALDVTILDAIPVTTPARTLFDIAGVVKAAAVEEALDDALRRGLVTIPRLRWRLDALRKGRPGVGVMRRLLDARDPSTAIPESVFERRLLRALRRGGLPQPVLQHEVRDRGRLIARVDFAYPEALLAIEADGYRRHSGRARWIRDRQRANELTLLGWRIIRVTWDDLVEREAEVVDGVRVALAVS